MGQKLVYVAFNSGSSPNLWNPNYSPEFKIEVSTTGVGNWTQIQEYCPNIPRSINFPVDTTTRPVTNFDVQNLIKTNQGLAFFVEDGVTYWRILLKDKFLTAGEWETLNSGSF